MGPDLICLVPYEEMRTHTQRDNHVRTEGEGSYLDGRVQAEERALTGTWLCWPVDLELPAPETVKKIV